MDRAPFCRMLPCTGTPIKRRLEAEGRLLGTQFEPDYRFLDPKVDLFYTWMVQTFYDRNFTNQAVPHPARPALRGAPPAGRQPSLRCAARVLHHLTAVCNRVACYTLRCAADHMEATPLAELEADPGYLQRLTEHEKNEERRLLAEVGKCTVSADRSPIPGLSAAASVVDLPRRRSRAAGVGAA